MRPLYARELSMDRSEYPQSAALCYTSLLLRRLFSTRREAQHFLATLLESRWVPLPLPPSNLPACPPRISPHTFGADANYAAKALNGLQVTRGETASTQRADIRAIRDTELGDYVEHILAGVIGAENVPGFIVHCLLEQDKWCSD